MRMLLPGSSRAVLGFMKSLGSSGSGSPISAAWSRKLRPTQTILLGSAGASHSTPEALRFSPVALTPSAQGAALSTLRCSPERLAQAALP